MRRWLRAWWLCAWAGLCMVPGAHAGTAQPLAADPVLEARVMKLAEELRCLVCQNQTIADSHAGLANDLKQQIREQLRAGRSDGEVLDYMVARFGDFVLYRPPVKASTWLLWFGPALLLLGGAVALGRVLRRLRNAPASTALSDDERLQAEALLARPET